VEEKRRHRRYPLTLCVRYHITAPVHSDWTENLSAGGVFVRSERCFEPGQDLTTTVSFPGLLDPIGVDGKVAWVRGANPVVAGGVGIAFNDGPGRQELSEVLHDADGQVRPTEPKPFRLLVVDDNERLLRSYERAIERLPSVQGSGLTTMFAGDGRQALELVAKEGADLVITDIYMPNLDGYQLIERLRADSETAEIPIIIITGGHSDERKRAEALGADAFLFKPVLFAPLVETIACLVAFRRYREPRIRITNSSM